MKIIVYSDKKTFLLTDNEFVEAIKTWSKKENYYCVRLEALLTPIILHAETPRNFYKRKIFIEPETDRYFFLEKEKLFQITGEDHEDFIEIDIRSQKFKKIMNSKLVNQEEYYDKENTLKLDSKKPKLLN